MGLDFDGVNSSSATRIRTAPGANLPTQHTIMTWFEVDAMTLITAMLCIKTPVELVFRDGGGELRTFAYEANWSSGNGRWVAPDNQWSFDTLHHFAVSYDSGSVSNNPVMYFDGASVSVTETSTPSGTYNNGTDDLLIAGRAGGLTVDGFLSDFMIYNRIVPAAEVQSIFKNRGKNVPRNGLIHRYKMDELHPGATASAAGSVKDTGSLGADGTPENSPLYVAMDISFGVPPT